MHITRALACMLALLLLCSLGGRPLAAQGAHGADSGRVVIDPQQSSLLRQAFFLEDLNAVLAPTFTPDLLAWIGKHEKEVAEGLEALLAAKVREVTFLVSRKDYLCTLELPEGNLEALTQGEVTAETLASAFGPLAGGKIAALMQPAHVTLQVNVQPNIHRLRQDCFFTVVKKRLLLGSTELLVEMSRKKLAAGNAITAIPADGQQFWAKTDLQVSRAPSEQGQFTNKNISYEYALRKTDDGFRYIASSNLPELLPALEEMQPLALDDIILFGNQSPLYSFVFVPKILDVLMQVSLKGVPGSKSGIPSADQLPFSFGDFERAGLFWGGPKAQILGFPIPGIMLAVKGKPDIMALLQGMLISAAPVQWAEKKIDGWDAFFTADMLIVEQTPIPIPVFLGRKGETLSLGIMNHDELNIPNDSSSVLPHLPEGVQTSALADMDIQGLWSALRAAFAPGSALRIMSKIDMTLTPAQVNAVEGMLNSTPPVRRMTGWSSPDLRRAEGHIVENPDAEGFVARLCELVDAFVPKAADTNALVPPE